MKGYAGKLLRINLSTSDIRIEEPEESLYRKYYGGTGFITYYLLNELATGIDPLGPDNKLIFALGPVTGHPLAGAGRNSVGAKSPLTGGIGFSEAGGFWGTELKRAGFDGIIIEGKAPKPSYIWINNDQVEIRDGSEIWGKTTGEVEDIIKKETGEPRLRVAQCGVAGENLVRYACILNDITHAYGRTGMGAVMGSKNLRAVAVRGTQQIPVADQDRIRELAKWFATSNRETWEAMKDQGTARLVIPLHTQSGLPTKNFKFGQFDSYEKISGQTLRDTILIRRDNCFACPINCKRVVKTGEPYNVDPRYGGPEYESLGSLGSVCGIDDLEAICKGNELCNTYALDTISTGMVISFVMECYENGILTKEDIDGIEAHFGNAGAMLQLIEKIAHREGIGNLLAEGVMKASQQIGKGSEQYAIHVKGQEVPMHEPRLKMALGVGYALSPTGADHCHNMHDTGYVVESEITKPYGVYGALAADDLGPDKIRLMTTVVGERHFTNCAGICNFANWGEDNLVAMLRAITGWNVNILEIHRVAERAMTLARCFNYREGFDAKDDYLPKRFYEPFVDGPLAGVAITQEQLEKVKRDYYEMMGWDRNTGIPTRGKMQLLGIEWALDALEQGLQQNRL